MDQFPEITEHIQAILTLSEDIQDLHQQARVFAQQHGYHSAPQRSNSAPIRTLIDLTGRVDDWLLGLPDGSLDRVTMAHIKYVIALGTWAFLWANARADLRNQQGEREHISTKKIDQIRHDRIGDQLAHAGVVDAIDHRKKVFRYHVECYSVAASLDSHGRTRGSVQKRNNAMTSLDVIYQELCREAESLQTVHPDRITI